MESDAREPRRGAAGQGRTTSAEKSPAGSVKRARERAAAGLPPERPQMLPYPTPLSVKAPPKRSPQQGTSPTDRARYPQYPTHGNRQDQGSSGSVPLASSRPRKDPVSPISPQGYTQTSPVQERSVGRGPPPQRPPRPNFVPPMLQSSGYRDNQPPPLQYRKPQAQNQPARNYWEDSYLDSSSSSRPLTTSTTSTGTGSSAGSIPDFPSTPAIPPMPPMPTFQPPPRRNLGPPPSARKGGSSYYSQTSFVPPIPEEMSESHSSYASSTVIPESWGDGPPEYYMGVGINEEEEEEDVPGGNSGRGSSAGDHDDASGLVRKGANPRITSLDTVESGDESDRGSRSMQELDWQARQDERWRPDFAGNADTDPIGRHNFRGNARLHPYSGYESDATFLDSPTGESPMPRALKTSNLPTSNAYFGTPSSTGSPVDPRVDQILGHLEKGGALASSGTDSPSAASMTGKGTKRPPNLNLKATKEGRDSATSLPELIRRATKLASNLDRGKTASRLGMLDMLNAKEKESRERAGKGSRTGSISDILAAFPSPSPTTPAGQRPSGWPTPSPRGKSNLSRAQTVNYGSSNGHRDKYRRCCGMPVWAFILLLIILLLLIAAAVIIPITLIVLPRQHKNNSPTLASCQTSSPCGNGGTNVLIDKTCRCVCANGFIGPTCNTTGDSSCTTSDVPVTGTTETYKNSTLGSSIPRLLTAAESNYSIPITSYILLSLFSISNLSCSSENALVTFNSQSQRRDLDLPLLSFEAHSHHRPRILDLEEVIAPPTRTRQRPSGILEARGSAQTSNSIIYAAPTSDSPSAATSSASAPTSDEKTITATVLDFARTAVLFIFQETSSIGCTTTAMDKLQATLSNGKTFDASDTSAGGNITVDLSALTVGFGNGTLYGGKGTGAKS